MGHHPEPLDLRLGDQEAVERIPVVERQPGDVPGVLGTHREPVEALGRHGRQQIVAARELPGRAFDRELPDRDGADQDLVLGIRPGLARRDGQPGVIREPPQQRVGVEEQAAQRTYSSNSGGM